MFGEQLVDLLLAPRLPLPLPVPLRLGESSSRFPHPWTVARWIPGEPGDRAPIKDADRTANRLAEFLRALHRKASCEAPTNPSRGVPLRALTDHFDERLDAVAHRVNVAGVRAIWDDSVSAPGWNDSPVWLHGDLHPANVVVAGGTLSGIIDFGDICAGDPATDLAAAWMLLPGRAVRRFFEAYAYAEEPTIRRARGWAILRGLDLLGIGQAWERDLRGGQQTWGAAGRRTLDRVLNSK